MTRKEINARIHPYTLPENCLSELFCGWLRRGRKYLHSFLGELQVDEDECCGCLQERAPPGLQQFLICLLCLSFHPQGECERLWVLKTKLGLINSYSRQGVEWCNVRVTLGFTLLSTSLIEFLTAVSSVHHSLIQLRYRYTQGFCNDSVCDFTLGDCPDYWHLRDFRGESCTFMCWLPSIVDFEPPTAGRVRAICLYPWLWLGLPLIRAS